MSAATPAADSRRPESPDGAGVVGEQRPISQGELAALRLRRGCFRTLIGLAAMFVALTVAYLLGLRATASDYWISGDHGLLSISIPARPYSSIPGGWTYGAVTSTIHTVRLTPSTGIIVSWPPWIRGLVRVRPLGNEGLREVSLQGATYPAMSFPSGSLAHVASDIMSKNWMAAEASLAEAFHQHPDRFEFDILRANALYHLGRIGEAQQISKRYAGRTPSTWAEEYWLTLARFDKLGGTPMNPARDLWRTRYPRLFVTVGGPGSALPAFDNEAVDLLGAWRSWDNLTSPFFIGPIYFVSLFSLFRQAGVEARMELAMGDFDRARNIGLGLLKFRPSGGTMPDLIVASMDMNLASSGLDVWKDIVFVPALHPEELESLWMDQEEALDQRGFESWKTWHILLAPADHYYSQYAPGSGKAKLDPVAIGYQRQLSDMEATRDLYRQGLRILYERRATGSWPTPGDDGRFTGFKLKADPEPRNPYETNGEFRAKIGGDTEPMTLYSIGSDGIDDGGFSYDPTNGTISNGDISLKIYP